MTHDSEDPTSYDVPPGADPAVCERCGRPLPNHQLLALHRGLAHEDLSERERAAYAEAYDEETEGIRRFRLVALGGVVALYFGLLLTYALVA
jgi:hypothetical protein